jgi:hypothetical protein
MRRTVRRRGATGPPTKRLKARNAAPRRRPHSPTLARNILFALFWHPYLVPYVDTLPEPSRLAPYNAHPPVHRAHPAASAPASLLRRQHACPAMLVIRPTCPGLPALFLPSIVVARVFSIASACRYVWPSRRFLVASWRASGLRRRLILAVALGHRTGRSKRSLRRVSAHANASDIGYPPMSNSQQSPYITLPAARPPQY